MPFISYGIKLKGASNEGLVEQFVRISRHEYNQMRCKVSIYNDVSETTVCSGDSHEFSGGETEIVVNCLLKDIADNIYSLSIAYVVETDLGPAEILTFDAEYPLWIESSTSLVGGWTTAVAEPEEHDHVKYNRLFSVVAVADYCVDTSGLMITRIRFTRDNGVLEYATSDHNGVDDVILVADGSFTADELTLIRGGKN